MMIRYVTHELHNHECGYTAASSPGTYDVLVDMAIACSFRAAHSPLIETIMAIIIRDGDALEIIASTLSINIA
jgi:hypothetical protein